MNAAPVISRSMMTQMIDEPDTGAVGQLIRKARLAKGWKQRQLADAVDTSTQSINRYENNERNITADMLMRLARALDIPVCRLFPNGDGLTDEERNMLAYLRTHPSHKVVVQSTLRGLREVSRSEFEAE